MRNNLIQARKQKGYTQVNTADLIGVTEQQYQRLEAGTSDGSIKVWERLKDLFGLTIDNLLEQVE